MPVESTRLDSLLAYAREHGRVCPLPEHWNRLWQSVGPTRRIGGGWDLRTPLILAAWHDATDDQKRDRLEAHLRFAADHDLLDAVDAALRSLTEDQWHHEARHLR